MSDIQRRVVTLFEAHGANQIRAALGGMRGDFRGWRDEVDRGSRSANFLDMQMRALGTTLRYGLAGSAVYGTLQLVRNLGEFQAKLGEISAIATGPGGIDIVGRSLDQLGADLIHVSNMTTAPIADLQEGVISLYSTIGDVPPNEAADMMERISDVSITAQSNIQDTTQALLGMMNAFGGNTQDLERFGDQFFKVIQLSAGMPGSIYAQKLGALSASASLGHFTPEQMGALAVGATRSGGSPSTNMQYLAQMMMFLMHPATKEANSTLTSIGLGARERQRLGGYETLKRFLGEVNKRGGVSMTPGLAGAGEDFLGAAENQGLSARQVGLSGGGTDLISKAFGRIQSQRMAAILSNLLLPEQVAGTRNKTLDQYLEDINGSLGETDRAMEKAMDYRRIVQAGNAIHNLGIEIGTALSPALQPFAKGITKGVDEFNQQKWGVDTPLGTASGQQIELVAAALGVTGLLKMLRGKGGGVKGLVRGTGVGMAAVDALTGEGGRGSSPLNPLYVVEVFSLTGNRNIPGVPSRTYRDPRIPERDMRQTDTTREKASKGGRRVGGAAIGVGTAYLIANEMTGWQYSGTQGFGNAFRDAQRPSKWAMDKLGIGKNEGNQIYGAPLMDWLMKHPKEITQREAQIIAAYQDPQTGMWSGTADQLLSRVASDRQLQEAGVKRWKGKIDMDVTVTQPGDRPGTKKTTTRTLTTDLFPEFQSVVTPAPQSRGKPTTRRAP